MPTYSSDQLRRLSLEMFRAVGTPEEEAQTVTEILVSTSLHGVDSHGVNAIPGHVLNIQRKVILPGVEIKVLKETPTTALWDGGHQLGHIVAKKAMNAAIKKASTYKMGCISTVSQHIGALYYYALMAVKHDMVGVVTCRARGRQIAPYNGVEGRLGTNPLSVGIPAGKEKPILLDMATSIVAAGHISLMANRGEKAPIGWLLDKDGNPTTDPKTYSQGGVMLPFGTYKGYGINLVIDTLGLVLGTGLEGEKGWAHTFMAIDPTGFVSLEDFKSKVDEEIRYVKSCKPQSGKEVLVPGEPEWREEERRAKEGIYIDEPYWRRFLEAGKTIGVDVNEIMSQD